MVQINFAQKTVTAKVVYYGPGMSGKTTNLEVIHQRAPQNNRGDLTSISTDGDRTLFFDFMPLDLGTVAGMRTSFQIYTVPGQVYYNSTRKLVLQGVDGVVFVADSSASMAEENLESLRNLEENLAEYGKSLATLPHVLQWNKRDLPDAMSPEQLDELMNQFGVPAFEAVANTGQGVFPTLKALAAKVLESIHSNHLGSSGAPHSSEMHHAAPAMPAAMPAPVQQPTAARAAAMPGPIPSQVPNAVPNAVPAQSASTDAQYAANQARGLQMAQTNFHNVGSPANARPRSIPQPVAAPSAHVAPSHAAVPSAPHAVPGAAAGAGGLHGAAAAEPVAQRRQSARTNQPRAGGGQALEGTRFRPRNAAARPAPRPTPVTRKRKGGNWFFTSIFVVLALAVGGVVTKIVLQNFL